MAKIPSPVLPDMLTKNLSLVFCGTAAGTVSAARGHYYAHGQNKFWKTLHDVGLTPERIAASDFRKLLDLRMGLTDIAKHVSGMDKELPPQSLGRIACDALRTRITEFQPRVLAFTSLTAGRRVLGAKSDFGPQQEKIGDTRIWILPSPSPAAHWNWDIAWWKRLAAEVGSDSIVLKPKRQL